MNKIKSVGWRRTLNSHVDFTTEFSVTLVDGSVGYGSSPRGETPSIFEDKGMSADPARIVDALERDGWIGRDIDQASFDGYLEQRVEEYGRNNCYALSLAFFNAIGGFASLIQDVPRPRATPFPRVCCNVLNGGWHAYSNPVLSDFHEYLLVSTSNDIERLIGNHNEVQRKVKDALLRQQKTVVNGNPVNRFETADNRECLEFLLTVVDSLGLSREFDLMIDASAGDLWADGTYQLRVTDDSTRDSEGFRDYWSDLLRQYPIRFLEDPFREEDYASWTHLTTSQTSCLVIGDNLYSSNAARIVEGAANHWSHGVVLKPNQAGSVSAVLQAMGAARQTGQIPITSHRSISTEFPFESVLTCFGGVEYFKVGPLTTDYSSVLRLNEMIRLNEQWLHVR